MSNILKNNFLESVMKKQIENKKDIKEMTKELNDIIEYEKEKKCLGSVALAFKRYLKRRIETILSRSKKHKEKTMHDFSPFHFKN